MTPPRIKFNNIDDYIASYPPETRIILDRLRETIKKAAPDANETINYGIPTFTLKGNLVHFAGFKNHIGFYPTPSGIEAFKKELSGYEVAKGSVKFPVSDSLPFELVSRIVEYRVNESLEKAKPEKGTKINNIDEYISGFPEPIRKILDHIRSTIRKAAPEAEETIKYSMPAFTLKGNLVYFAAFKNHISLYPAPSGDDAINNELSIYKAAKGTLRFPLDKPIPYDLIGRVVKLRVKESMNKTKSKGL